MLTCLILVLNDLNENKLMYVGKIYYFLHIIDELMHILDKICISEITHFAYF